MHSQQDLQPFEELKRTLLALCEEGRTGTLYLINQEKRMAMIIIQQGDIINVRYRVIHGAPALDAIKEDFQQAKLNFREGYLRAQRGLPSDLPPTKDALARLGIVSDKQTSGATSKVVSKKVLVVEDSATQRKIIARMLEQEGYQVIEAVDGFHALAQLGENTPDLILLDIVMPRIDGYKILRTIKKTKGMADIPVIMLTSRDKLFDKVRGKMSGSDEYLTKPFKREELMAKINLYLGS